MNTEIRDEDKTILNGRVYPAIQNCVNNRYKIIAGYIAILGFLLLADNMVNRLIDSGALKFLPIIFTVFVLLNSINYYCNTREQIKLENGIMNVSVKSALKGSSLDIVFSIMMWVFIWGGYCFLKAIPD